MTLTPGYNATQILKAVEDLAPGTRCRIRAGVLEFEDGVPEGLTLSAIETLAPSMPLDVPAVVTSLQLKLALQAAGLFAAVEAAIASSSVEVAIVWNSARYFERSHLMTQALAASLNLSSTQVDDLFREAAQL